MVVGVLCAPEPNYKPPAYGPPPRYEYSPIPQCAKNTTKSWCLEDTEYPIIEVHTTRLLSISTKIRWSTRAALLTESRNCSMKFIFARVLPATSSLSVPSTSTASGAPSSTTSSLTVSSTPSRLALRNATSSSAPLARWFRPATSPSASRRTSSTVSWSLTHTITLSRLRLRNSSCQARADASSELSTFKIHKIRPFSVQKCIRS